MGYFTFIKIFKPRSTSQRNNTSIVSKVFFIISILTFNLHALSATPPQNLKLLEEIPPPPKVIEGEPLDKAKIKNRHDGKNKIEEYSINGQVYMMKVTPPSGKSYYLHRASRDGEWVLDGPSPPHAIPKWVLFRF